MQLCIGWVEDVIKELQIHYAYFERSDQRSVSRYT